VDKNWNNYGRWRHPEMFNTGSEQQPDIVEMELWDHYSGLPNPTWYEYRNQLENEEDTINNIIHDNRVNTQIQDKEKK